MIKILKSDSNRWYCSHIGKLFQYDSQDEFSFIINNKETINELFLDTYCIQALYVLKSDCEIV